MFLNQIYFHVLSLPLFLMFIFICVSRHLFIFTVVELNLENLIVESALTIYLSFRSCLKFKLLDLKYYDEERAPILHCG